MSPPPESLKGIPITDHHVHLRLGGQMDRALGEFARQGGRRLLLVHTPYDDLQAARVGDFRPGFERTLQLGQQAQAVGPVEIRVALGPYPVELLSLATRWGLARAIELMEAGFDAAAREVEEGRAIAIGEVGRPHFPVEKALWDASNDLIRYGMRVAKAADCPIILHTEEAPSVLQELAQMADEVGLPRGRVVKHYAGPWVSEAEALGVWPSVLARRDWCEAAARSGTRFLLETDYLDDEARPGAVLGPGTVPRRSAALLAAGLLSRDDLYTIHATNVEALYGDRFSA